MVWTREFLDSQGCSQCAGDHAHEPAPLYLHARCHLKSKLDVSYKYTSEDGARLYMSCQECGDPAGVIQLQVPEDGKLKLPMSMAMHGCDPSKRTTLYFDGDVMIICSICDKAVGIFPVA
jgi:hypothetical protein